MIRCDQCNEPAVRRYTFKRGTGMVEVEQYCCYVHAVEAGLLGADLDVVRPLAAAVGFPENAIFFVLEAAVRASEVTARDIAQSLAETARERLGGPVGRCSGPGE